MLVLVRELHEQLVMVRGEALEAYGVVPALWSRREEFVDRLAAEETPTRGTPVHYVDPRKRIRKECPGSRAMPPAVLRSSAPEKLLFSTQYRSRREGDRSWPNRSMTSW